MGLNLVSNITDSDNHGHGTRCADIIGSKTYSVAKNGILIVIKVLDKNGSGYCSKAINLALDKASEKGVLSVVVAINDKACNYSSASAETAFIVAASDIKYNKATFPNFGKFVSMIALGIDILSTWNDSQSKMLSSTSIATPHVIGVTVLLI